MCIGNDSTKYKTAISGQSHLNRQQTMLHNFLNFSYIEHYQTCHIFYKQSHNV